MEMERLIFIGDSHTSHLGSPQLEKFKTQTITSKQGKRYECVFQYSGPKLAYNVEDIATQLENILNVGECVFFYFGEIDIRTKLTLYRNPKLLATKYFEDSQKIANKIGVRASYITPVLPSDIGKEDFEFPRNGNLINRRIMHLKFTRELRKICRKHNIRVFGNIGELTKFCLTKNLTDDGVHLNPKSNHLLLSRIIESHEKHKI